MTLAEPFFWAGDHVAIELPGAHVVFTTRRGGSSRGPYASLNLGRWTDDEPEAVERNRASLAAELGVEFAYGRQVHGSDVACVKEPTAAGGDPPRADGQATSTPGLAPLVLTADCLPIAIAGDGAVAMVHAGWRGLAGGVIAAGVAAVRELGAASVLCAAVGPGAGPCCYEVGDEVRAAFADHDPGLRPGRNLDLPGIAAAELLRAGVEQVHLSGLCTICSPRELFYSHRRDHGITGRQAGIAWRH